jgi:uncharacterized protein (TIGR00369 family)
MAERTDVPPPRGEFNQRVTSLLSAADDHRRVLEAGEHLFQQLKLRDVDAEHGDYAMELELDPRFTNPRGGLQGGLVATLADVVAGRATFAGLPDGWNAATSDLSLHYLAPITVGPARAEAHVLRRGRTSVVVRVDIHDVGTDRLAASGTVAYTILPPLTPPGSDAPPSTGP